MYSQEYKSALDSLFQGFKTKNYEFIKPLLDSNVKIGTLPQGMNDAIVPQILQQMPTALSYSITGEADDPDGRRIKTTYHLEDGKDREQNYLFNSDKKVIDFDVLGDAKAMAVTNAAPSELPERMEIPFKVHENVIFVKANLNGKEEFFILDSGAPTFIINSDYVVSNIQSTAAKATGVGGKAEISVVHIDSFDWNGLKMENFDGMAMSLGHLEKASGKKFAGLIGYTMLSEYQITFDYSRKILLLEKTDSSGETITKNETQKSNPVIIPFVMQNHIPVFDIVIEGKTYKMGLDCGAGSNLLHSEYFPQLKHKLSKLKKEKLLGAGKEALESHYAKIDEVYIGGLRYKMMQFVFEGASINEINQGYKIKLDGLLGYEFLKKHKTAINFKKGEILIYTD